MTDIKTSSQFDNAAKEFEEIIKKYSLTEEEVLKGYALFKQGKFGDNTKPNPGSTFGLFTNKEQKKWEAYKGEAGTAPEKAQEDYVKHVEDMQKKYGS